MGPSYGTWEHFSIRDGLPDMKIECLFEDSRGTLWIGTKSKGVVAYTGDDFTWYTKREGLSGNSVFGICEAQDGAVWLATDAGLSSQGPAGFAPVEAAASMSFLWGAASGDSGNVWFGLDHQPGRPARVAEWDDQELRVHDLEDHGATQGRSIHATVIGDDGRTWCGGNGLFVIENGTAREVLENRDELRNITALGMLEDEVVIATAVGLFSLRGEELSKLASCESHVEGLLTTKGGDLWATTREGRLLRMAGEEMVEVANVGVPLWRPLIMDRRDRLWVGSYGFGLYCYDETRSRVHDVSSGLPDDEVQAIAADDGTVWIGTSRGLVDQRGDKVSGLASSHGGPDSENVTALQVDRAGRLWIGKRNGLVFCLEDGVLTKCATIQPVRSYAIGCIVEDAEGSIWVGSMHGRGVGRYETPSDIQTFGPSDREFPSYVGAMVAGRDGTVFLGSAAPQVWDGVVEYDGDTFRPVEGISNAPVTALCIDQEGRLWVGTTEGVQVCDRDYVLTFGREDGLPSELITALYADSQGRIWIGTEGGGACVYDGKVFQALQLEDRPFCNTVHDICEDGDGAVWFATNGGAVRWSRKDAGVQATIEEIVADTSYPAPSEVQFPDTVGRISISFRGASEIDRSRHLVYRFRLQGYETDWRQTRERQVDYPKLEPGEYEFVVRAVDRDLNYSAEERAKIAVVADPRIDALNQALRSEGTQGDFVGQSHAMREVLQQVTEVAWTDLTVLVLGETGTGKGLAARQIHDLSERRKGPFIHVNCGALQHGLVDSELFGHERGAFTGALSRRLGKFELAQGGTIFLDEIGDLPLDSQARLLKVLQDKTIERVGGTQTIHIDVRVIAATNRDLAEAIREHRYRADLYYRLNVFPIRMPPLRERREDTLSLAEHFIATFSAHLNQPTPELTQEAASRLLAYDWPGNVRELEHTLQRAVILSRDGKIEPNHLGIGHSAADTEPRSESLILPLEEYERRYFTRVLEYTGGVIHGKRGAASLLEMKPTTLRSRLEKLGLKTRRKRTGPRVGNEIS